MPRNAKPIAEKYIDIHTTFPPDVAAWLRDLGDGVAGRGMRLVVLRAWEDEKRARTIADYEKLKSSPSSSS